MRLLAKVTSILLGSIVLTSCGVSAIIGNYNPQQEAKYDTIWNSAWNQIAKDSQPLKATSTSPGVCNIGGSQQVCFDTDVKLIADYRLIGSKLSGSVVPSEFGKANRTFLEYVSATIKGLSSRDAAIVSQNPNASLTQSNNYLKTAETLILKSLGEYRGPNKPSNPFS